MDYVEHFVHPANFAQVLDLNWKGWGGERVHLYSHIGITARLPEGAHELKLLLQPL